MENSNYRNKNIVKKLTTWYKRLTNYIPEPIKKLQVVLKIKLQIFLR